MAKIVMECPACKMPVIAGVGLLARKTIKCECGFVVPVDKMGKETCPNCGESVVYDRTKTYTPRCPSCKIIINVRARILRAMNQRVNSVFGANTLDLSQLSQASEES